VEAPPPPNTSVITCGDGVRNSSTPCQHPPIRPHIPRWSCRRTKASTASAGRTAAATSGPIATRKRLPAVTPNATAPSEIGPPPPGELPDAFRTLIAQCNAVAVGFVISGNAVSHQSLWQRRIPRTTLCTARTAVRLSATAMPVLWVALDELPGPLQPTTDVHPAEGPQQRPTCDHSRGEQRDRIRDLRSVDVRCPYSQIHRHPSPAQYQ